MPGDNAQASLDPCPDHPYFPGEPPPEDLCLFALWLALRLALLATLCWAAGRYWPWLVRPARIFGINAGALVVASALFLIPLARRQTGEWQALRRAIKAHDSSLRAYGAAHPGWTNKQIVDGYLRQSPERVEFHFQDPSVSPVYIKVSSWRDSIPRIVVAYNSCNNALFDPDTMWVEKSD